MNIEEIKKKFNIFISQDINILLNAIKNETLSTALVIGLVASILGLITHNEQLKKERKFFRLFIFFSVALVCSLFSTA